MLRKRHEHNVVSNASCRHFARHVLRIAPESDREVIRDGCAALDEELSWMDVRP